MGDKIPNSTSTFQYRAECRIDGCGFTAEAPSKRQIHTYCRNHFRATAGQHHDYTVDELLRFSPSPGWEEDTEDGDA